MNFYHAYYKRQVYKDGEWVDTSYTHQGIVVLANNPDEATAKIMQCLERVEAGEYRAVLNGAIAECLGIDLCEGIDGSFYTCPIG